MLLWLASYPRSGNTFVRSLLRAAFGLESYSLHDDSGDFPLGTPVGAAVGHRGQATTSRFLEQARSSDAVTVIKTHEAPLDDSPAIYIVRDGRSAVVSFFHYLAARERFIPLRQLIDGVPFCGSWSSHFNLWQPLSRPNTLLLRFEEITQDPHKAIDMIAAKFGLVPKGSEPLDFSQLQSMSPKFFRSGSDAQNLSELDAPSLGQFYARHARLMVALNYIGVDQAIACLSDYATTLEAAASSTVSEQTVRNLFEKAEEMSYLRFVALQSSQGSIEAITTGQAACITELFRKILKKTLGRIEKLP